jgi:hypothetical protein
MIKTPAVACGEHAVAVTLGGERAHSAVRSEDAPVPVLT